MWIVGIDVRGWSMGAAMALTACGDPFTIASDAGAVASPDGAVAPLDGALDASELDAFVADAPHDAPSDASLDATDGAAEADVFVCNPASTPSQDPCVLTEALGVFVSAAGSDASGDGSRAQPFATIGRAMDVAAGRSAKRVYACGSGGPYPAALALGASRDGVSVYGGLDCSTAAWTYDASQKAVVAPSAPGYALTVSGLSIGVTFEDVEFEATDASPAAAGASSVAVFVSGSQGVAFHRVTLVAGQGTAGGAGASGGTAGAPSNWATGSVDGTSAVDAGGAPAKVCACVDTTSSTGGQGGGTSQTPGAGLPPHGVGGAGSAGTNGTSCGAGNTTGDGADAPAGTAGAPSTSLGALSSNGWTPASGATGANGVPGQGGGGGGDGRLSTGGGGSGACGGCGGAAGTPGTGGGASIALLSYQSAITLVDCTLTARSAGAGGVGGNGEAGQVGGTGGLPFTTACLGGAGGAGSGGNGGQGGAGGLSLGIAYGGTAPTVDGAPVSSGTTVAGVTIGTKGAAGPGGAAGAAAGVGFGQPGASGATGPSGLAQAVLAL